MLFCRVGYMEIKSGKFINSATDKKFFLGRNILSNIICINIIESLKSIFFFSDFINIDVLLVKNGADIIYFLRNSAGE